MKDNENFSGGGGENSLLKGKIDTRYVTVIEWAGAQRHLQTQRGQLGLEKKVTTQMMENREL